MSFLPVITGVGLVTPLGQSTCETWSNLLAGRFIADHARAEGGPNRVSELALQAAREAMAGSGWILESRMRTALILGTSKGAVDVWTSTPPAESFMASIAVGLRQVLPLLNGPSLTISSACASGIHALIRAAMMIQSGEADRVLVVAAEASVHPMFLGSFTNLGVFPRQGVRCRPFDESRDGFLMSEAAAAACVEAGESGIAIERYSTGGDATHLTAGDPAARTLRRLLRHVTDGRAVDLVHAHGTGTRLNDPAELSAIEDECVQGGVVPLVYSHKGALGHSLGAAGLVSVVLNCLIHGHGQIPRNAQLDDPIPTRLRLARENHVATIKRSIAVAAGFGGALGAVSLVSS